MVLQVESFSQYATVFTTPYGLYEFVDTPFGLRVAPPYFHQFVDHVCRPLKGAVVIAHFDDVNVHSHIFDGHIELSEKVFLLFQDAQPYFKPSKTVLSANNIEFLGRWVSLGKVYLLERHVDVIRDSNRPTTLSQLSLFF